MAIIVLPTFPDLPQSLQTLTLELVQYRVRFTWRERLQAWYLDLLELDETPIVLGQRVSPGWGPLYRLLPMASPPGLFFVSGPEPYSREMLGSEVVVLFASSDEIPPDTVTDSGLTVTL